ncbi:MAG: alpha/beta hydrolase [Burkholderiaceae bacterium]
MATQDPASGSKPAHHPPVLFLHANGFPTGAYRRFLDALAPHRTVIAPQVIDTPAASRASRRWPQMVEQVQGLIAEAIDTHGAVSLVGHSMGGYLALIAAARQRAAIDSIVLLDSPLVTGWRGTLFGAMRTTGLTRHGGPAPIAARRRFAWATRTQAREHFESKSFARRWAPGVLDDFLDHGLRDDPVHGVSLRVAREIERDIYANLPAGKALRAFRQLRGHGVPIHMIAGRYSAETRLAGREGGRRLFGPRWHEIDGGHLVPMEQPEALAARVLEALAAG